MKMSVFDAVNTSEPLLVLCNEVDRTKFVPIIAKCAYSKMSTPDALKDISANSILNVVSSIPFEKHTPQLLTEVLKILKPDGKLIIANVPPDSSTVEFNLKTNGFTKVISNESSITASKPKYEVGSSVKLTLKKPAPVWKIDDVEEDDLIDPDDLLDEDDLKKPDPTSLKVCGTTGKRKACKDCSCGLADELAVEAQSGKVVDTSEAPKSSCGSCYLGDAFRCASCPYIGMPAFKPGEKIQLTTTQLKSDI